MGYIQLDDYCIRSEPDWVALQHHGSRPLSSIESFQREAEQGNPNALFLMAFLHERGGFGIAINYRKAIELYMKAADAGHLKAHNNLGILYDGGRGTAEDQALALSHYWKACHDECPEAYFNIACMIKNGRTIDPAVGGAALWFDKAKQMFLQHAEKGIADSQLKLGLFYKSTKSDESNIDRAENWLTLAANQGVAEAQYQLGYCLNYYRSSREHEALSWFILASEQGHPKAQLAAWQSTVSGNWNDGRYVQWLIEAGSHGNSQAQLALGGYYEDTAKPPDFQQAHYWYTKGAEQGNEFCMIGLGALYAAGKGVDKDYATALRLFLEARQIGGGSAWRISELYRKGGFGIEKNLHEANYWDAVNENEADDTLDDWAFHNLYPW